MQLTPLLQLTALTCLWVSGITDGVAGSLSRLQELDDLQIMQPSTLTDAGLQPLTALTQLTRLKFEVDTVNHTGVEQHAQVDLPAIMQATHSTTK